MTSKLRFFPFLLIPIILFSFWLGARGLNADALWYDEWFSIFYADGDARYDGYSLTHIWERVAADRESMPPGYYWLLHSWGRIAGYDAIAMRAFSLFCGMLGIAAVYRLGRDLHSRTAGLAAAAAFGLSAYIIFHMHEVRNYTLYPLIVCALVWSYWRVALSRRPPTLLHAVGLAVSMAALIYTHYMGVTVLLALGAYHLLFARKDRRWLIPAACAIVAGLALAPWALTAIDAANAVGETNSRFAFADDPITLMGKLLHTFSNGAVVWIAAFAWFALPFVRRRMGARYIGWMALVTIAISVAANVQFQFLIGARYLVGTFPLLALVVGVGADAMARRNMRPAVWIALFMAGGAFISVNLPLAESINNTTGALRLRWDWIAPTLAAYPGASDDLIALLPNNNPYWFYAPVIEHYLPVRAYPNLAWMRPPRAFPLLSAHLIESLPDSPPPLALERIERPLERADGFWLALSPAYPPSPLVRAALERAARPFARCDMAGNIAVNLAPDQARDFALSLHYYARIDGQLKRSSTRVAFGDRAELRASVMQNTGRVVAVLRWRHDLPPYTYSVALHWEDAGGAIIAQADAGLPPDGRGCQVFALEAPAAADSTLRVVVYDWQSGARLDGVGEDGVNTDRPVLSRFAD
ncbi:MAG: glycosyltransferase family 39 protein [Chloroflexota bacterium]|nr:glycosyltransferase family 39 protein [Chloroflexota bacterium]